MRSPLGGTLPKKEQLIDIEALRKAYYEGRPKGYVAHERIHFGTSGHRGMATENSFNELHVAAITQAICDCRREFGAEGPCFVGHDTHLLSEEARKTVLCVLVANHVSVLVDVDHAFMPTPALSHSLLAYNEGRQEKLADGIIITPSHNPPDNGGIKYNTIHGGPAGRAITERIEKVANAYMEKAGEGICKVSFEDALQSLGKYPVRERYVADLVDIIDMEAIQKANLNVLIDAMGGSGFQYWEDIVQRYHLPFTIIHNEYDPTFKFMTVDHDGIIRMDCSSEDAMAGVIQRMGEYDVAIGNDPDYDRYGVITENGLLSSNQFLTTALWYLCTHRNWKPIGIGKTVVVSSMVDRVAKELGMAVYETPVGFKYFEELLFQGKVCLAGEESAGGSFLKKDGNVWSTDKDGIIMALLALEMVAVTGKMPEELYRTFEQKYGKMYYGRREASITAEGQVAIRNLDPAMIQRTELAGGNIIAIRNTSLFGEDALGGLAVFTDIGWIVARPSGTEPLYKIYGESFVSKEHLEELLASAQALVDTVIVQS